MKNQNRKRKHFDPIPCACCQEDFVPTRSTQRHCKKPGCAKHRKNGQKIRPAPPPQYRVCPFCKTKYRIYPPRTRNLTCGAKECARLGRNARKRQYCARVRARRAVEMLSCELCEKLYPKGKGKKFCSRECREEASHILRVIATGMIRRGKVKAGIDDAFPLVLYDTLFLFDVEEIRRDAWVVRFAYGRDGRLVGEHGQRRRWERFLREVRAQSVGTLHKSAGAGDSDQYLVLDRAACETYLSRVLPDNGTGSVFPQFKQVG